MKIFSKKRLVLLLASLLVLTAAVGGSIAYLAASTEPLTNTFTGVEVDVEITDKVTSNVKSDVVITNTGTTDAYIRARIVGNWVDDEKGYIVQAWDPAADGTFVGLPGTNWVQYGNYYYYTLPVAPGAITGSPLFTSYTVTKTVEGAHLEMDIIVQAIQSAGGAAKDAWGVDLP